MYLSSLEGGDPKAANGRFFKTHQNRWLDDKNEKYPSSFHCLSGCNSRFLCKIDDPTVSPWLGYRASFFISSFVSRSLMSWCNFQARRVVTTRVAMKACCEDLTWCPNIATRTVLFAFRSSPESITLWFISFVLFDWRLRVSAIWHSCHICFSDVTCCRLNCETSLSTDTRIVISLGSFSRVMLLLIHEETQYCAASLSRPTLDWY